MTVLKQYNPDHQAWETVFLGVDGDDGIVIGATPPPTADSLWADTTTAGDGVYTGPPGPVGPVGPTGPTGPGVPVAGTTGQVLVKTSATNYATGWRTTPEVLVSPSGDTSGVTDNANIAAAKATVGTAGVGQIRFGPGKFYITTTLDFTTTAYGANIQGEGHGGSPADASPNGTQLVMLTNNVPIIKIWGAQHVDGLCLIYNTQQTTAHTESIGCSINALAGGAVTNVRVWQSHIGFGIPQVNFGASSSNLVFNSVFTGLHSYMASKTHYDFRNFNGGGTNCRLGPLYANGGGSLDFVTPGQSCDYGIRGTNLFSWEFGAISIDGLVVNERLVDIAAGSNYVTIDTIRCEGINWKKDGDGLIGLGGSDNICRLGIFEVRNTRWTAAVQNSMYLLRTNATRHTLDVGAMYIHTDCDFGTTGLRRPLFNTAADTGTIIRVGTITDSGSKMTDLLFHDSNTTLVQPVREWNGTVVNYERRAGRSTNTHRVYVATAIPTTGTFAVDDELLMDIISATDPVCAYRCITAGTPGTWRPIAWVVSRGTTAQRPTLVASDVGVSYMDNTLNAGGKPIWWNGTAWVDSTGASV